MTFHAEACDDPVALAKDLRAAGRRAGLAIDRDTPVEPYLDLLPHFDTLLIMTIKAGFGGQEFMPGAAGQGPHGPPARRRRAPASCASRWTAASPRTPSRQAAEAGADAFVAGTAVYGADDPAAAVRGCARLAERPTEAGR